MIATANPAIWHCSNSAYHAEREHESSSTLSCFIQSRPLYHGRFVLGTIPRDEPTQAMQLGTGLHIRRLEPDLWNESVSIRPEMDRRTKLGKIQLERFCEQSAGKTILLPDQVETIDRMNAAIDANLFARDLFAAPGQSEFSLRWELEGVRVKTRIDRWLDAAIVVDLKTTTDPSPEAFSRDAYRYGYHRQAWLYRESVRSVFGGHGADAEFLHVVCGSEPPYECHVYELDDRALALGEREIVEALHDLRHCRETGNWSSPLSGRINKLSLPKWAF